MKKVLLLAVVLLAAGCSDFATAPDRVPAEFRMTPDTVLLSEGETVAFEYTVVDATGQPYESLPLWASPIWTYSKSSILSVDATGLGRAKGPGEVEATANLSGLTADAVVRVNPSELGVTVAFAHITQGTQRLAGDVPLIAGRPGLLRVYVRGDTTNFFEPSVRATFYRGDTAVHTVVMTHEVLGVPTQLSPGRLERSFDAPIPGAVLQPGTGLVLEIDPDGILPATAASELRVPETGEYTLPIQVAPPFHVRLVPITQSLTGTTSRFENPDATDRLALTGDVFPLPSIDADVRAPYTTDLDLNTQTGWYTLIQDIWTLRADDGSPRYYYGGFRLPRYSPYAGLGALGEPVSIGRDGSEHTLAHELGHNFNLLHAPCTPPDVEFVGGPDPNYPYLGALIGEWGWDRRSEQMVHPDEHVDLMSYCAPAWISDYNYENVIAYRDTSSYDVAFYPAAAVAGMAAEQPSASRQEVLVVHAGVLDGQLRLSPALRIRAAPVLPAAGGRYTLQGLDGAGAVLFSLSFEPRALDHGGSTQFSAAIPVEVARPDRLAVLRVTGPEGVVERRPGGVQRAPPTVLLEPGQGPPGSLARWDTGSYPLAVARDAATGRILGIGHNGRLELPAGPSAVEVTLSDGVRSRRAEVRR